MTQKSNISCANDRTAKVKRRWSTRGWMSGRGTIGTLDQMLAMRSKDTDDGLWKYSSSELPAVLSKVQKGKQGQRHKTENGWKQRARRLNAEPASRLLLEAGSVFIYLMTMLSLERNVSRTDSMIGRRLRSSSSLHVSIMASKRAFVSDAGFTFVHADMTITSVLLYRKCVHSYREP